MEQQGQCIKGIHCPCHIGLLVLVSGPPVEEGCGQPGGYILVGPTLPQETGEQDLEGDAERDELLQFDQKESKR